MLLLGNLQEYYALLRPCEATAAALDAPGLLGSYYACLAACEWATGAIAAGQVTAQRAVALCETAGDAGQTGVAYTVLARCELNLDHYDAALAAQERALQAYDESFNLRWYVWTWTAALWAHGFRGHWAAARAGRRRGAAPARSTATPV